MPMHALGGSKDIEFNSDLISEATLKRWSTLTVPPALLAAPAADVSWLRQAMASPAFQQNDFAAFYDEAQVQAAVKEAVDTVNASDEFRPLLMAGPAGGGTPYDQVFAAVKAALLAPAHDQTLTAGNFAVLKRIRTSIDAGGVFECHVDGVSLLRANTQTDTGNKAAVVMKVAAVFIDIVMIVMAAAGIMAVYESNLAQRFVRFVDKISEWFLKMMEVLFEKLQPLIKAIKAIMAAGGSSTIGAAVKKGAQDIARAIAVLVDWAQRAGKWAEFKAACLSVVGVMLNSGWKKFAAGCQLIASMLLLLVSAGTSLVLKIIQLGALLVVLMTDLIALYDLTQPS